MCGNFVDPSSSGFLGGAAVPIIDIGAELLTGGAATPWLPFINAGLGTGLGLARGESFGKAFGQGAISGGETFAGQELLGAAANQFPETFGSLGVTDTGGNSLTDILGTTQGAGSLTGAGTIGGDIKSLFSGGGANVATTPSAGVTSAAGNSGLPSSTPAGAGVGSAAGVAAPSGVAAGGGDVTNSFDPNSSLNSTATAAGGASPGTQGLAIGQPNTFSGFAGGTGGANIPGATEGFGSAFTPAAPTQSFGQKALSAVSSPSALLAGGGLVLDAAKATKLASGEAALKQQASQLSQQGQALGGYLQSGTLPPGLQQGITQATNAAKATIRSQYASRGMSGSSAEQQELQAVDERAQAQGAQQALQLLQMGVSETGMASGLYQALMGQSLQQDKDLSSSIAAFAAAAGGGSPINTGHA